MTKLIILISFYALTLYLFLCKIISLLKEIICLLQPKGVASINFYTCINGINTKVESMTLRVDQTLPMTLTFADKNGNPAVPVGVPVWAVSDATLATVVAAADGMSAVLTPVGPLGGVDVTAVVDGVTGMLHVDLVGGAVATVTIVPGTPV
jgi:hypothetical protein